MTGRIFYLWLLAAVLFGLGASSNAQTMLKLGHILPPTSPEHQAIMYMADKVKEKSRGTLQIQVFHSSQLGSVTVMLESLQAGGLDMMVEALDFYGNWDKRFGAFNVPYLFRDREQFKQFLAGPTFKQMIGDLEKSRNLVFLHDPVNWWQMSDRTLLTKRPVTSLADLKGMKLRMFQARVPMLAWQTLGANTVIIPWGETYAALATGTAEAVTARVEAHYQMKQTEVAKFMTVTKEFYQAYVPVLSKKTVDKLTPAQTAILRAASREAGDYFTTLTSEVDKTYRDKVRNELGVQILEPPLAPWRAAMQPAIAKLVEEDVLPRALIKEIQEMK